LKTQFQNYIVGVIKGKKRGMVPSCVKALLYIISIPYRLGMTLRNFAFDYGWIRSYSPPVPVVISIGNIVVGGTGKTPATLMIAKEFCDEFSIAILSRGYRSQAEKLAMPVVLSAGDGPLQSAAFCGDEPYLLAQNIPKAHVIVGASRHKGADMAAKAGAQLILLDDGMQHRHLARDKEIVVMDISDPFGQGRFFPFGFLREGASSLKRADLIILNHVKCDKRFQDVKGELSRYSKAPIIGTKMAVIGIRDVATEREVSIHGQKVGIFSAIANPEYFQHTVTEMGAEMIASIAAPDHKRFKKGQLEIFAAHCKDKGAQFLVCTEKDKVKIDKDLKLPLPIVWVKMRLQLVQGNTEWSGFIAHIKDLLKSTL